MSAAPVLSVSELMSAQVKNPPELYRWALGWILSQVRNDLGLSQEAFGEKLEMSQAGYRKLEKGMTPNFDLYLKACDEAGKDIVAVMGLARVLVRAVEAEEASKGEEVSDAERNRIAAELYSAFN
jgi:transcriptional regulator with XRE-family HTH domain